MKNNGMKLAQKEIRQKLHQLNQTAQEVEKTAFLSDPFCI